MDYESVFKLLESHCMLCGSHRPRKSAMSSAATGKPVYYLGQLLLTFHPCISPLHLISEQHAKWIHTYQKNQGWLLLAM